MTDEGHFELKNAVLEERKLAAVFVQACVSGDVKKLILAAEALNSTCSGWRRAMIGVARQPTIKQEAGDAFEEIWASSKSIPRKVGDRRTLADALHVIWPPLDCGSPLLVYRGTRALERTRQVYGFCWTTDLNMARKFAKDPLSGTPVVLKTVAPAKAIFRRRKAVGDGYEFDEDEVIVDPFRLGSITIVAD